MTSETVGSWLGVLAAWWNLDGLAAWTVKLVVVLSAVLALTALFSLGFSRRPARAAAPAPARAPRTGRAALPRPQPATRVAPLKNLKKKRPRIVRRYRPRSHAGTLRPLTRRATLKLVEKDKPLMLPRAAQATQGVPAPVPVRQRAL